MNFELAKNKTFADIKRGDYVLYDNRPHKVDSFTHSKTGKHGSMKVRLVILDCVTNKKSEPVMPGHHAISTFKPVKHDYQLMDVTDDETGTEFVCIDKKKNEQVTLDIVNNHMTGKLIDDIKKAILDTEKDYDVY